MKKLLKRILGLALFAALVLLGFTAVNRLFPMRYIDEINAAAARYDLEPALVCAVVHAESRFVPEAQSPRNANGLMQLMQQTADWGAAELKLADYDYSRIHEPALNLELGCWYLRRLLNQYGVEATALAAYNAGSGNVSGWLADAAYSADGETLIDIPFGETARYVQKIERNKTIYSILLWLRRYV